MDTGGRWSRRGRRRVAENCSARWRSSAPGCQTCVRMPPSSRRVTKSFRPPRRVCAISAVAGAHGYTDFTGAFDEAHGGALVSGRVGNPDGDVVIAGGGRWRSLLYLIHAGRHCQGVEDDAWLDGAAGVDPRWRRYAFAGAAFRAWRSAHSSFLDPGRASALAAVRVGLHVCLRDGWSGCYRGR